MTSGKPTDSAIRFGNGGAASTALLEILDKSESSICLPYELSIIEIDRILSAIGRCAGTVSIQLELSKGGAKQSVIAPTPFGILDFIFNSVYQLPTAVCTAAHGPTESILYWDDDERFALIAGPTALCLDAFPHSYEVLEHYYVQASINEFEDEQALRNRFAALTFIK